MFFKEMSEIFISIDSCIEFLRENQVLYKPPPICLGCNTNMTEAKDSSKGSLTPQVFGGISLTEETRKERTNCFCLYIITHR